jgi:hypothetical protein
MLALVRAKCQYFIDAMLCWVMDLGYKEMISCLHFILPCSFDAPLPTVRGGDLPMHRKNEALARCVGLHVKHISML